MSDQPQDELALVLRRISSLSSPAVQPSDQSAGDDAPVLTDVYEGAGAFSMVEIEQLLAPYYADDDHAEPATQETPESLSPAPPEAVAPQASGIKFLPADVDEEVDLPEEGELFTPQEFDHPQLLLARQELAEAVLADMQPMIAQVIQDVLAREMQALVPKLGAEVEGALAVTLRERVIEALKKD